MKKYLANLVASKENANVNVFVQITKGSSLIFVLIKDR